MKKDELQKKMRGALNREYGKLGNRMNFFESLSRKEKPVRLDISDNWSPLDSDEGIMEAAHFVGDYISNIGLLDKLAFYSDNPHVKITFEALESHRAVMTPDGVVPGDEIYVPFIYRGFVEGEIPNSIVKIDYIIVSVQSIDIIARTLDKSFKEVAANVFNSLNEELQSGIHQPHISVLKRP